MFKLSLDDSGTDGLQALHRELAINPDYADQIARFDGPPVLKDKAKHPAIQMADVLAYEMHLNTRRLFYARDEYTWRGSWDAISKHRDRVSGFLSHWGKPPKL